MSHMRAVIFRARRWLRQRWVANVAVACVVAVVAGAVLTLVAGARRTAHAPDAYTAALGGNPDGLIQQRSGRPRTAEVRSLPAVREVEAYTFLFAAAIDAKQHPIDSTLTFAGDPVNARFVAGRPADPDRPHEFVADKAFATEQHAQVGSRFRMITWDQAQAENGQAFNAEPKGPTFEGVLVGIVDSPDKLESDYSVITFSPALLRQDVGVVATLMSVRLAPGTTTEQLRAELDGLPDGRALSLDTGDVIISSQVRDAVNALAVGLWIMAGVAAIGAVVAVGQLLTRHARLGDVERRPLTAIGSTRKQLAAEILLRGAIPALAGVVVGIGIAVAASGIFPVGFARATEPDPGVQFDAVALLGGGLVLLVLVLLWVSAASSRDGRQRLERAPSRTGETLARRAPSAAAATGTRFAFTNHEGSSRFARGTFVLLAVMVVGVVGALAFGASLDRLVTDRARFGSNYAFAVGDNSDLSASDLRKALADNRDIDGMMILSEAEARSGGTTVELIGMERVRGDLAPHMLSGRVPSAPDELALGHNTARQLHLGRGDHLTLRGSAPQPVTFTVVGITIVPTVGGNDGVGEGAVVTSTGLHRLEPEPDANIAAVTLRPGAPANASDRIKSVSGGNVGVEDRPPAIVNVSRVRGVPLALAALLGAMVLLTMVHVLIVAIQGRRHDVAVLRALGANRRWVARAVHWQATVLTGLPILVGAPLGLLAGSALFRVYVDHMGALPDPAFPFLVLFVTALGLVVLANLAAVVPAYRARQVAPAQLLRDD
jgi:ABC-type lipoprotein release transport system permease subunit